MIVTGSPHGLHFLFSFFLKKNSLSAKKSPPKQPLERDPVPAQGAQCRDLYCQGLQCGRSVNYSNKDFKKKKNQVLRLIHFFHYSKGAVGTGKRQSKQKGLGALHS